MRKVFGFLLMGLVFSGMATALPKVVALQSVQSDKYVRAGVGQGSHLAAVSRRVSAWETFMLVDRGGGKFALQSLRSGRYVRAGVGKGSHLAAVSKRIDSWETFKLIKRGGNKVALQCVQSLKYVRAGVGQGSHLAAASNRVASWETFRLIDSSWRPDFGHRSKPHGKIKPISGTIPVLTLLVDFPDFPIRRHNHANADGARAYTRAYFERFLHGPRPSVRDWFRENSYGKLKITNAGVIGWLHDRRKFGAIGSKPKGSYRDIGIRKARTHAVKLADARVNFSRFDRDRNGYVTRDELSIIVVYSQEKHSVKRGAFQRPINKLTLDGVTLADSRRAATFSNVLEVYLHAKMSQYVHELCHAILGLVDLYKDDSLGLPGRASDYSIMDSDRHYRHLSPWEKIHLGWIRPKVVVGSGWFNLKNVEKNAEAYILYDPGRGTKEYFIVENRWKGNSYDGGFPRGIASATAGKPRNETKSNPISDQGLAIWHVNERHTNVRKMLTLKTFSGTNGTFEDIQPNREGRSIRYYIDAKNALWDGSDRRIYDLTPTSNPEKSTWSDGSRSKIVIARIPRAASTMRVWMSMEGKRPR